MSARNVARRCDVTRHHRIVSSAPPSLLGGDNDLGPGHRSLQRGSADPVQRSASLIDEVRERTETRSPSKGVLMTSMRRRSRPPARAKVRSRHQRRIKRPAPPVLTALAATSLAVGFSAGGPTRDSNCWCPRARPQKGHTIGAAVSERTQDSPTAPTCRCSTASSTVLVAENEMKWDATEPQQGRFNYGGGDRIVSHARANGMSVRGHALLWHAQQPGWAQNLSGSDLRNAAINHVTQVATHFRGTDLTRGTSSTRRSPTAAAVAGGTRTSSAPATTGSRRAFRAARAADPNAKLCYNDYNTDGINAKSTGIYNMVRDFKARGVPIDCVGLPVPPGYLDLQRLPGQPAALRRRRRRRPDHRTGCHAGRQPGQHLRTVTRACLAVSRCTGITVWGVRGLRLLARRRQRTAVRLLGQQEGRLHRGTRRASTAAATRTPPATGCATRDPVGAWTSTASARPTGHRCSIWDCHSSANQQFTQNGPALQVMGKCLRRSRLNAAAGTRLQILGL